MFRYVNYFIAVLMIVMLFGITSAQGDLDNDGIPDNVDPETIVSASTSLDAGDYTFLNLSITNGATLTLESNSSFSGFKGVTITANNVRVDSSSIISADGKGYSEGPGLGTANSGGGYGGHGGASWYDSGGMVYGSALQPLDLGSGAGSTLRGGGAIRLIVTDKFTINGQITSSGNSGIGGSGGSIYITAHALEGSGNLKANGGNGPWQYCAGGGGGRIAVYYNSSSYAGSAESNGGSGYLAAGQDGTVVFIDSAQNILYPGNTFRFEENDSPFVFSKIILNDSRSTINGTVTLSTTDLLIDQGSEFNLNTPGRLTLTATTLHINGSSTLLMSGNETVNGNTVLLTNSATLSHVPDGKMYLNVPTLTVDSTSTISADGKGYTAGPGSGTANSGGGYGGHGGQSSYDSGGIVYGSALQPVDLGSGSGSTLRGGGAIRLIVSEKLTIDGQFTANGDSGIGGSGGSIYITAHTLEGSANLKANGGNGPWQWCGGGGGGRIAVYYASTTYTGSAEAKGGSGYLAAGQDGTVVFIDSTQNILYPGNTFRFEENDSPYAFSKIILNDSRSTINGTVTLSTTDLLIDQGSEFNLNTPGRLTLTATNLHINGSSTLLMSGNETVNGNTVLLTNSATLSHVPDGKMYLNVPTLTVDSTSTISADGKGYTAGPGAGRMNSGGGYGGHGSAGYACCSGDPSAWDNGGPVYGSALQPVDLGSGSGSRGGGAIRLIVTDKFTMNGPVTSNGNSGAGGSGGSIYITAHTLEGSGNLTANGGNSLYQYCGGGGGGRIAVYYAASTYSGGAESQGGSGYWGPGQDGTIVFIDSTQNILYPGHSFRFDETDGSFVYEKIILNDSRSTINGTVTLSTTDLLIDQGSEFNLNTPGRVTLTATTLHINGSSTLLMSGNETVNSNTVLLTNSATLSHVPDGKMYLNVPTLTVDSTSTISADGKGYTAGPGAGRMNSGGGYGGHGSAGYACCSGDPSAWDNGGPVYGSALQPVDLGSGSGSRGGGAIRLIVTDKFTMNGPVTSNGNSGAGGSGGSIYITVHTLEGSGNLKANGGNGLYQYCGGGGGGRIAVYYTASTYSGGAESQGGSGYWGPGQDGTVRISALTSDSPISLTPLTQITFTNSTLSETIRITSVNLENATVRGNMTGTLDIPEMKIITVATGSFKDEGFSMGEWNATLEGVPYKGILEGTVFFSKTDNKTYLKGTTGGAIIGILEGEFTESVPGSGIYDLYFAAWQINQVNSQATTGTLFVKGSITPRDSTDYPTTGIYAIQTMIEGTSSGHYTGPLTTVLTHVRIADPRSAYNGEGFSLFSYSSQEGYGKGWTYDRQKGQGITELHGSLSSPLSGIVGGTLDETTSPLRLFLSIERMDLGIPVMADLEVIQPKTLTISPGQTWDYVITIRNNGLATAENVVVVDSLPPKVTYINSSQGGIYKWDTHEVIWKLGTLAAKTSKTVSVKVTSQWGLPSGTTLENSVMVGTTSPEKDVYLNPDEGLYNLQEYLNYQPTQIISKHFIPKNEFQTIIIADPAFNDLYTYATERGYKDTEVTGSITLSDGTQLTQHYMESPQGDEIAIVTKEENPAHPDKNGATIIGFHKENGVTVFNREGRVTLSDAGVTVEGTPSPYTCRYVDRLRNCLAEALPGIGLDVASQATAPGVQTAYQTGKTLWDLVWRSIDCTACRNPDTPDDKVKEYCEGCFQKSAAVYQDLIDAPPVIGDLTYCGVRATDPSMFSCTYCTYTSRCPSKWNIFAFPNSLITTHCTKDCRIADASEEYPPNDSHYRPFRLCDKEIPNGKCKMVSSDEAKCIDPKNTVDQPTFIWVARDPNIKYGQEGHVLAGQTLDYRIEYENEGQGIAFGVYFIDTLDEDLDASSLTIGPVYSTVDSSQIAPSGLYNPGTRTITWLTGEVGPHEGGYANISVKVRSDAPDDTEIINYGIVYFPSVPEETRTNAIVSVVGINHPPAVPANPTPSDNDTTVINTTGLHWTGGDPDGDTLRYDVYFGNVTPLPLLERDTFSTLANPGNLAEATTYSWQIIARDPDGAETPGPVWKFSTISAQPSVLPLPGFTNPPTDPDGDGLYEDLNANGFADWDDAVVLFWNTDWIQENEPLAAFDFNHNGFIDWDDAVVLFWEV